MSRGGRPAARPSRWRTSLDRLWREAHNHVVAGSTHPSPEKAVRSSVLLLTNDDDLAAARTTRHLALALNRIGFRAVVRDTRLIRWGAHEAESTDLARREAFEVAAVAKWAKLVEDYGIGIVISLDLHWLVSRHLFVTNENVREIHSFWVSDVPEMTDLAPSFALEARELIAAGKVIHHVSTERQVEALRRLGARLQHDPPGAPSEYLRADAPCLSRDRLGHSGDPTPATAARVASLVKLGWLDVHGSPEAWKAHGVAARPLPPFPQLPTLYRRHPAWLNLGNDAQLFEVAACGRMSLCLDRPGVREWFADGEIVVAADEAALVTAAQEILRDPDAARVMGEQARARATADHLWETRLKAALA